MSPPDHAANLTATAPLFKPLIRFKPTRPPRAPLTFRDIVAWLDKHHPLSLIIAKTRTPIGLTVFAFLCAFPVLAHLISRLTRSRPWFNDYEAILCAARAMSEGRSPYGPAPQCAGMAPAPYVYAPQIADMLTPLTRAFSVDQLRLGYALVLIPMIAAGLGLIFMRTKGDGFRRLSILSLTAMGGGAMASGNIGFVLLGMIIVSALYLETVPLVFVFSVLAATLIKPVYLGFLLVLLYRQGPLKQRLLTFTGLTVLGLGLTAALWLNAGPLYAQWQASLQSITLEQQPGIGFFALTSAAGLTGANPAALIAYGLYAVIIAAGGLYLAKTARLSNPERMLLGLGAALLINPRLMDYDMAPLGPFIAMLLFKVRTDFGPKIFARLSWAYAAPLGVCLIANVLEIDALHRAPFAVLAFALITLCVLGLYARRDLRWLEITSRRALRALP